jgi:membrane fusion protein (multidrug efflux system)
MPTSQSDTRRRAFLVFGAVVIVAGLAWGTHAYLTSRGHETTDDAYVAADLVTVTSEAAGTVLAVNASDTQPVDAGARLVELDPADARVAVAATEASLARAVRDVATQHAQRDQLAADLRARELALDQAQTDLGRREPLRQSGALSAEELAHAVDAVATARASVAASRAQLLALEAQLGGTAIAAHPRVLEAAATLRGAMLALHRTSVRAPISGLVAKRAVQVGQRIAPGTPLLALVSLRDVWVDANFKELQLRRIRIGQPAEIHADLYGSEVTFHGRVIGVGAGSGNAFALLPSQNASGNWIKIVQRLPVRIALDPADLAAHPLRVGLSTTVDIDVRDEHAAPAVPAPVPAKRLDATEDAEADRRIAEIIASQAGTGRPGRARSTRE